MSYSAAENIIPLTRSVAQEWAAEARRREAEEAERKQIRELERQVKREARLQVGPPATHTLQVLPLCALLISLTRLSFSSLVLSPAFYSPLLMWIVLNLKVPLLAPATLVPSVKYWWVAMAKAWYCIAIQGLDAHQGAVRSGCCPLGRQEVLALPSLGWKLTDALLRR